MATTICCLSNEVKTCLRNTKTNKNPDSNYEQFDYPDGYPDHSYEPSEHNNDHINHHDFNTDYPYDHLSPLDHHPGDPDYHI